MLLGQTLDGMRVWDIRRAVQMIHFIREGDSAKVELSADDGVKMDAKIASLFEPGARLAMTSGTATTGTEPDFLNLQRLVDAQDLDKLRPPKP